MRLLGTLALLMALLVGCGDETSAGSPSADSHQVTLVSGTAGGGDPATRSTDVTSDDDLTSYVAQFDDSFAAEVTTAAGKVDVPDGEVLVAQVVSVGCDVPPGATVMGDVIVADKVAAPMKECLAPVTTVGLATVPA